MLSAIAGWIGMILILTAYWLISNKKITGQSRIYYLLNLFGSFGIFWNSLVQHAWPVMSLNVVWAIIAISVLIKGKKIE